MRKIKNREKKKKLKFLQQKEQHKTEDEVSNAEKVTLSTGQKRLADDSNEQVKKSK